MPSRRRESPWRTGDNCVVVGTCCVGTPPVEVELRKVFAAGACGASLDPDELTFSGMVPSTLIVAAGIRCPVRPDVETDLVRLMVADILEQREADRLVCRPGCPRRCRQRLYKSFGA